MYFASFKLLALFLLVLFRVGTMTRKLVDGLGSSAPTGLADP
jgi:hypothetical protein